MGGPSATPVVLSVVFSVLAGVAVLLRLYARRCKSLRLQSDDYFIMVGLVSSIAEYSHVRPSFSTDLCVGFHGWHGGDGYHR